MVCGEKGCGEMELTYLDRDTECFVVVYVLISRRCGLVLQGTG